METEMVVGTGKWISVLICIMAWTCCIKGREIIRTHVDESTSFQEKEYYEMVEEHVFDYPPPAVDIDSPNADVNTGRPGSATDTHSCDHIRSVPGHLRRSEHMYPNGLTNFYRKYTEAYGIPIVSSHRVSDNALRRACYTVRFLFADVYAIRNSYYKRYGRFAIIGVTEGTTSIPEHSWLPNWWNQRARGLGATDQAPVSTGGEENALCYEFPRDRYRREDIVLHEYAHGFHLLGAKYGIDGFQARLTHLYQSARQRGLWANTYAQTNEAEYFAEGVQSYFNAEAYASPPDGIHNHVSTRDKLQSYDPGLYELIRSVFPCNNRYILRCDKDRESESQQHLHINCDGNGGGGGGGDSGEDSGEDGDSGEEGGGHCEDLNESCSYWAGVGECHRNPAYMHENCRKSCDLCEDEEGGDEDSDEEGDCDDNTENCAPWAARGECRKNPAYMTKHCRRSCGLCDTTDDCRDNGQHCVFWAREGYCHHERYGAYMSTECKRSCRIC